MADDAKMDSDELPPPPPQKKPTGKQTIEQTYQKKSQLEHILLRPDTYIGSVEKVQENTWIYNDESGRMEQKLIEYVPGLYKIFDEILVNAADNKQRDKKMDTIKIDIDPESNVISVWNNGQGIPVVMHKEEKMYVPTMIFGHLLTSSNYNDEEEKVTGGRNGYGAKLCNIFSTKFTVETASKEFKHQFKQVWGNNMSKVSEARIKPYSGEDFTKITFSPDLSKFKMDKLDDGIVSLMSRRAFDVAASTRGVKVFLNGKRVPVKTFKDYVDLFIKGKIDETGNSMKIVYDQCGERWEVALTISDHGFQQMSFVNSIATTKGGRHVDYVVDMIVKQLLEVIKKKNKGGVNIKPFQVKNHLWVFVNCLIVNPTFDSQTKENMTLQVKSFGSKCVLTDTFKNQLIKSGAIEATLLWAKFKAQTELQKASGKKSSKIKGIPKLEDANEAGTRNSLKCTLILTEGDSAKGTAMAGLGVIGRDYYGVFPLRGKILNVREATHKQILENVEINNLIKIVGLQYKKKYNTEDDMKTLRYGKIMIMTDQDQDGSHIKGLLINFVHHNWPELLKRDFLEQFITPIVKARKNKEVLSFYSLPELEEWKSNTPNYKTYDIKYYKGLGTSDPKEGKEYFANIERHRIRFEYKGQTDDDHILLAFSKKHVDHRKEWLTNFMIESRRRKEIGLPEKYLYNKTTRRVTYTDFINLELILFSNGDNIRSIPSMMDGLKPAQRKVLYVALKRNDRKEVKVGQLVGAIIEKAAYHHSDTSLAQTIISMAQNFVGSNNINLLEPKGQFGTRIMGGKDAASPRYIFTKLSPLTKLLFSNLDTPLLKNDYDDNVKIEPYWYAPIIPMVLVNGAEGIGTGWMTKIPNYNARDLVANIRKIMDGEEPDDIKPWYKNFRGTIESCGDNRYMVNGEISIIDSNKIEITELPVGTWTQNYKESVLEPMLHGSEKQKACISDYKDYSTDITVKFVVTLMNNLDELQNDGLHKMFKLQTILNLSSMNVFDEYGCLKNYDNVTDLQKDFYKIRLELYGKRKEYMLNMLEAESKKLTNQARFIKEKCEGKLKVENKKRIVIVQELIKNGYDPDPVKEWKQKASKNDDEEEEVSNEADERALPNSAAKNEKDVPELSNYDYLLGMSMWMLTDERKEELLRQSEAKASELKVLQKKSPVDLWREDLDVFMTELEKIEKSEKESDSIDYTKKKAPGKKKIAVECMPSPVGKRVVPVITQETKRKIQNAIKHKEKLKNKKEIVIEDDDEFDKLVNNCKSLKEKVGTPEEVEKKVRKRKGAAADGLKQTKLTFPKMNGSPKKREKKKRVSNSESDATISDGFSDEDFVKTVVPPVKERTVSRRAATKVINYDMFDDKSEESDLELLDNNKEEENNVQNTSNILFSSDEEENKPPERHETSESMFDTLVGRKKPEDDEVKTNLVEKKRKSYSSDSDVHLVADEDEPVKTKKNKKPNKQKKIKVVTSDDESPLVKKKTGGHRKLDSSDEEFSPENVVGNDKSETEVAPKRAVRGARAAKTYHFSSDDSDY